MNSLSALIATWLNASRRSRNAYLRPVVVLGDVILCVCTTHDGTSPREEIKARSHLL